ncbi:acyl carrier protein [Actinoplanes sp. NPDC026619]|uniref:acyl carrier protein n=1 Tax=Actinoplanes sp. NPDC026619 TaxID=3155798 RepID=UPI0033CDF23C
MSDRLADAALSGEELVRWVVDLWRSLIDLPDIDADTHLLDVPASSLTAVRMRSRIQSELGKEIDLIDILDHPTPREMAELIARAPAWTGEQPWPEDDWSTTEDD